MFNLSRRPGEAFEITIGGEQVLVHVKSMRGGVVILGLDLPASATVRYREFTRRPKSANPANGAHDRADSSDG